MKPDPVRTLKSFDATPHVGFEPKTAIKPRGLMQTNSTQKDVQEMQDILEHTKQPVSPDPKAKLEMRPSQFALTTSAGTLILPRTYSCTEKDCEKHGGKCKV